jgi:tetratricopeptide (TPR) repeat protein
VALRSCFLGDLQRDLGGLTEARSHYRRALQIIESSYGSDNLDAAVILNNLGDTTRAQGETAEARSFFARALGIFRDKLGPNHPYTLLTKEHLDALPQTQLPQETEDDDYDSGFYF